MQQHLCLKALKLYLTVESDVTHSISQSAY